jgi:hypothetical protein
VLLCLFCVCVFFCISLSTYHLSCLLTLTLPISFPHRHPCTYLPVPRNQLAYQHDVATKWGLKPIQKQEQDEQQQHA